MKKTLIAIAAAASALTAGTAFAQSFDGSSPWQVRVRAVHLNSDNGGAAGDAGVSINNKWMPEVDVSYYFTPNIAAELVLTYPQKHDVRLGGDKVGSLKHLPPTLLAQYHFTNFGAFKPYVGAGAIAGGDDHRLADAGLLHQLTQGAIDAVRAKGDPFPQGDTGGVVVNSEGKQTHEWATIISYAGCKGCQLYEKG